MNCREVNMSEQEMVKPMRGTLEGRLNDCMEAIEIVEIKIDFIKGKLMGNGELSPNKKLDLSVYPSINDKAVFIGEQLGLMYKELETIADYIGEQETYTCVGK